MFTGLVKEIGLVKGISRKGDAYKVSIECKEISRTVKTGDSVAINGTCLTVTGKDKDIIHFDAVEETIRRTNLESLKAGDRVNLEDSLKAGDPLGGHFVLGHIDCVSKIISLNKNNDNIELEIVIPKESAALVVEKGSIAIDGISLTVGRAGSDKVKVFIIPHTFSATILKDKRAGDSVNIEFDILGKYILRAKSTHPTAPITEDFLKEKGFV